MDCYTKNDDYYTPINDLTEQERQELENQDFHQVLISESEQLYSQYNSNQENQNQQEINFAENDNVASNLYADFFKMIEVQSTYDSEIDEEAELFNYKINFNTKQKVCNCQPDIHDKLQIKNSKVNYYNFLGIQEESIRKDFWLQNQFNGLSQSSMESAYVQYIGSCPQGNKFPVIKKFTSCSKCCCQFLNSKTEGINNQDSFFINLNGICCYDCYKN